MKRLSWKWAIFIFCSWIPIQLYCSPSYTDTKICSDQEFFERVCGYYELEKKEMWNATYNYRTPLFRNSISKEFYIRKMREDNHGWKLVSYEPVKCKIQGIYAVVTVEFIENVPEGYFPNNLSEFTKITENTTWEKINGTWFVRDAGDRIHLSLNGDMVMEDNQKPISIE